MKPKLERTGRHTLKTPELCNEICARVAKGETLTDICRDATMPDWSTVHRWAARCDVFRNDLARARELQAEVWADELVDISMPNYRHARLSGGPGLGCSPDNG